MMAIRRAAMAAAVLASLNSVVTACRSLGLASNATTVIPPVEMAVVSFVNSRPFVVIMIKAVQKRVMTVILSAVMAVARAA